MFPEQTGYCKLSLDVNVSANGCLYAALWIAGDSSRASPCLCPMTAEKGSSRPPWAWVQEQADTEDDKWKKIRNLFNYVAPTNQRTVKEQQQLLHWQRPMTWDCLAVTSHRREKVLSEATSSFSLWKVALISKRRSSLQPKGWEDLGSKNKEFFLNRFSAWLSVHTYTYVAKPWAVAATILLGRSLEKLFRGHFFWREWFWTSSSLVSIETN